MRELKLVIASSLLGTTLLAVPAFADVAPDYCERDDVGKACSYAGGIDRPGTCQKATCERETPDGPMTYECYDCVADPAAAEGKKDDGSCALASAPASGLGGLLAPLAALGLALARRRRTTRA